MNDEQLRHAYEAGLSVGTGRAPLDDVAAERLRRLVEREGSDEERLRTLDQQLSSAEGRRELELVWAAARVTRPHRPRPSALAAAAALLMVGAAGTWLATRESAREERGDVSPITLVAPLGVRDEGDASRFIWRSLAEADRYTLVVVDTTGREVFAAETGDTMVVLPDSVHLAPGTAYLWWVQARTRQGASITAVTQRLTISAK